MFFQKTTLLITKLTQYADLGQSVLYINHACDDRPTEQIDQVVSTHNSLFQRLSPNVKAIKTSTLSDLDIETYDIIGVDEGQFFEDLIDNVSFWVDKLNKTVIVAGLSGDFERKPLGSILSLIPHADKIRRCSAMCKECLDNGNGLVKASFTIRLTESKESVVVGGSELYMPVCRTCYLGVN